MNTYRIVYAEREFARIMGDPVLLTIKAHCPKEALKKSAPFIKNGIMEIKAVLDKD